MGEAKKDELVAQATDAGVPDADELTKAQLEDRLEGLTPSALGPAVPEGEYKPPAPKASGSPTKGVQPLEDADIPDAGR